MRDFYDVYEIMNSKADQISFDVLKKAFAATCMKRETSFGEEKVRETLYNRNILTTNQLNLQNYKII